MADQGLWFKLWCSSLDDPDLDNLSLEDFARWAKLGALIKRQGTSGALAIAPPARTLCAMFQLPDYYALVACFIRLPHVIVRSDNGSVSVETPMTVSFHNWLKYQGDYSTARVRRFRSMKRTRGEETRGEETRREETRKPPPLGDAPNRNPETVVGPSESEQTRNGQPERLAGRPIPRPAPRPVSKTTQVHPTGRVTLPRGPDGRVPKGPVAEFLTDYTTRFTKKLGAGPDFGPRDVRTAEELCRSHPLEEILGLLPGYFEVGTRFSRKEMTWSLAMFKHCYTDLVGMKASGAFAELT